MEAISNAGSCVGIQCTDGVIMVAEKQIKSKLWVPERSEKFSLIDDHIFVAVAGITSDASVLVDYSQRVAQQYKFQYQENQPVDQTVHRVCDLQQSYTQYGGLRPYGVSMLWGGYDRDEGFQLFHSDPSGNYAEWSATAIGQNAKAARSILKEDYSEDITVEKAIQLCMKILTKTMDSPTLDNEKLEMAVLQLEDGRPQYTQLTPKRITEIIKEYEEQAKKEEDK